MEESLLSDLEAQIFVLPGLWQAGMDEVNPGGVTKQEEPKKERFLSALGSSCFVRLAGASLRDI